MRDGPTRVLVVDDQALLAQSIAELLASAGYATREAHSLEEARRIAAATCPHVILTDVQMPGGSGLELLTAPRALGGVLPTILLMTGGESVSPLEAVALGAADLLQKPFTPQILLAAIANALHRANRRSARVAVCMATALHTGGDKDLPGLTTDIAAGGLFVACTGPLPALRQTIAFTFTTPLGRRVEGRAVVRWHRPTDRSEGPRGFGAQFVTAAGQEQHLGALLGLTAH